MQSFDGTHIFNEKSPIDILELLLTVRTPCSKIRLYGDIVKVIFKQKVLKEEKIKFGILMSVIVFVYVALAVIIVVNQNDLYALLILTLIFLPWFLTSLLVALYYLEWFCVYEDRIEVKTVFGIKNSVYYDKVCYIEEQKINLTTRGLVKDFYIFNDGRKNTSNTLDVNSCYNNKKRNVRIYKTNELENYINNYINVALRIKINN